MSLIIELISRNVRWSYNLSRKLRQILIQRASWEHRYILGLSQENQVCVYTKLKLLLSQKVAFKMLMLSGLVIPIIIHQHIRASVSSNFQNTEHYSNNYLRIYQISKKLYRFNLHLFNNQWCWTPVIYYWPFVCHISFFFNIYLFIWLRWVFLAARGLSLVVASRGYSSLRCMGFSLWWLLLLWSMGSRRVDFCSCGTRAQ